MTIQDYLNNLQKHVKSGFATEHTYRPDLKDLIEALLPGIMATNEPTRIACGAPDYILTKRNIPVGYIEAKDIIADLNDKKHQEQFDRYRKSLPNLIITDYLQFKRYVNGELVATVTIGSLYGNKITGFPDSYSEFELFIKDFGRYTGQTIRSANQLAVMMADKARLLGNVIELALAADVKSSVSSDLSNQYAAFKEILIHDLTVKGFADLYAQTIAYGLFAARLHDTTLEDFSRQEAAQLIPKSNPFLRRLFNGIAGPDLDERINWIVDSLAEVFRATDVADLLKDFGNMTQQNDPIMHFYETFLAHYDSKLRKSRGVYYTPEPVVNFIVRAVDDILKTEFSLKDGLADTSKIKIKTTVQGNNKAIEQEVHKVQILDPATGTGTFLAEVIKRIHKKFEGQEGIWNQYVENHLIPRLNGFELLMAPYAIAHLKLDLLLSSTGYKPQKDQRFGIYLTNSLEQYHPDTGTLFANWLSAEANEANAIKRDTPIMIVIGNPPYSVSSTNKNEWIDKLTADYKKDLNEKSYNSLSDDYVKFIRLGQYCIDKNGFGILAYISNNSFIDGITHRQMRKHLLESFDKIYILDLHGNSKKRETCHDGSPDQNVFDIMQGVSINIFIKTGKKRINQLGTMLHFDLQGKREFKYNQLNESLINTIAWDNVLINGPNYFYVQRDFIDESTYNDGFDISELFSIKAAGIKTHRDDVVIGMNQLELKEKIETFLKSHNSFERQFDSEKCKSITYRPFDNRLIYYDTDLVVRHRKEQIRHSFLENLALLSGRQTKNKEISHFFVTNTVSEMKTAESSTGSYHFQLYSYPKNDDQQIKKSLSERLPNLNQLIVSNICKKLSLDFNPEKTSTLGTFAPIDVFDFIYAVLYSPTYRESYKEFLKIGFPRIPYPENAESFWKLVEKGGELRTIHLLENSIVDQFITTYPVSGDNEVTQVKYEGGKVWINPEQYFDKVPEIAWNFHIGGYQPAQKWLKDRKGRILTFEDIRHYQKIIVALTETDRIMKEIDKMLVIKD
ncbi:MAG: type ISP restriction/modification enzyme [Bacteroidales bacterium]